MEKLIKDFEKEYNCKVIYVTKYGSKLYGTDNVNSDTDYKGIFIPSKIDVLLKQDLDHWTYNSNNKNEKNSNEDIDCQFFSIYKFFNLLDKGETGALDILFSMFRKDTIVFENKLYTNFIRKNYDIFYNKKLHSFIGYCIGQSKKYNIKGDRYKELLEFMNFLSTWEYKTTDIKLEEVWSELKEHIKDKKYEYIKFVLAQGPKNNKDLMIEYIEVLGSKFSGNNHTNYFYNAVSTMESQFGNRTKLSATDKKSVDWKSLSHACRVILEVEELLTDNFITFPLKEAEYVKSVKEGKEKLEDVMILLIQN